MKKLLTLALVSAMLLSGGLVFAQEGTVTNTATLEVLELEVTDGVVDWGILDGNTNGWYTLTILGQLQTVSNTGNGALRISMNGSNTDKGWILGIEADRGLDAYVQEYQFDDDSGQAGVLTLISTQTSTTIAAGASKSLDLLMLPPTSETTSGVHSWVVDITGTSL